MKRATLATTLTAAAVLVGGGAIGAYALSTQDTPAPAETIVATETPAPEATPTAAPTPTETSGPVEVTPTPQPTADAADTRQFFIDWATPYYASLGVDLTEEQIVTAGTYVCDQLAAGVSQFDIMPLEGLDDAPNQAFTASAKAYFCAE
ncbi:MULTISPECIES: hypothetical protein [unclassified Microbacterium]|uniref:hypothetical protein n=1 Tax=Microbacterium TaxID=33882 RepID=UPI003B9F8FB9